MKIGSLFSGAGGLDMAVEQALGARTVWHCEIDPAASKVLAHRWPSVPNFGSVTDIDWSTVEPVDVLCGGFPCQDLSCAGKRAGLTDGTRSGLWAEYARAVDILRPRWVVIENVRGILSAAANRTVESDEATLGDGSGGPVLRALGAVLGDLADIGYDAQWVTVAAADVGAPHRRERVFILATPADTRHRGESEWPRAQGREEGQRASVGDVARRCGDGSVDLLPTPVARDHKGAGPADMKRHSPNMSAIADLLPTPSAADGNGGHMSRSGDRGHELLLPGVARAYGNGDLLPTPRARDGRGLDANPQGGPSLPQAAVDNLLPTPSASDGTGGGQHPDRRAGHSQQLCDYALLDGTSQWGKYAAAIERWEQVTGRPAPSPTEPNRNGNPRLAAAFPEWMMGWPAGWVTEVPGISRNDALRIIGNGVCPHQAHTAIRLLISVSVVEVAS
ncbi:DNA methyltransferase [Mycobacterium phage DillTech15]|uniref:Cytosine-specific methyltransferase n=1 Tax=Mycobacterium phage DillTech15 TaxID=2163591 RepID=A0A2S1PB45_9CAUD|nr:DNA methyltransferase [Mycobacterium phage DillTech15]AWH13768.1 methyltransferase [Mycobacterium phage DillTech15]